MRKSLIAVGVLAIAALVGLRWAGAEPKAGEKPKFSYKTTDGKEVSPSTLTGHLVILDFWATWCGPCMAAAPHMVELNKELSDKGVAIIGVSLDADPKAMADVAKQQGFTWPQICDGKEWEGAAPREWGVHSIPHCVILAPDGTVVWSGHPGNMEEPLKAAVKKYPTMIPLRKKAAEVLQASIDVADKDPAKAVAGIADLPEGFTADANIKALAAKLQGKLNTTEGKAALNETAEKRLADLAGAAMPKNVAPAAAAAAVGPPKIADSVLDARLAKAAGDKDAKRNADAYDGYKWIVRAAPGTPQAKTAETEIAAFDADPAFAAAYKKTLRDRDAASTLWLAKSLEQSGKIDQAKVNYAKIVKDFADTPSAAAAKDAINRLK